MVSRVYQQYGYEYCKLKEWEKAKLYYIRALSQTPFSVIVMYNIGYCYEMMNDYRQALIWYNKALTYAKDEKSRTMLTQRIEDLKRELFMTS
ncbi:MAG: tetratricopeptide repeat protein [Bacteroidales bacterium]|nr:tetratricopeptide repeat protein [Bacteroidales bacterium]